ncbi:hypothetical protein ACSSV9_07565 [Melioribacter sp. OK-6-Me]|uniref:hypothetical protein n=1 Tax=Melioribacter sp. OK-6-Me TaxID=3423433 RepID=UPI003EDB4A90
MSLGNLQAQPYVSQGVYSVKLRSRKKVEQMMVVYSIYIVSNYKSDISLLIVSTLPFH